MIKSAVTKDWINLAFFTSCREVGLKESVGRRVIDPQNGVDHGYRMGNLEHLARLLAENQQLFAKMINLKLIFMDDNDQEYLQAWAEAELWPRDLLIPQRDQGTGRNYQAKLQEIAVRIPSRQWRQLKQKQAETTPEFLERKARAKRYYEQQILNLLTERQVDLIICDSYIIIFSDLLLNAYPLSIINIHPGIIISDDPNRLLGLTPTRDAYTRAVHKFIIIDDKGKVGIPAGPMIEVEYGGGIRKAVRVAPGNITGVTFHLVTEQIDNGPIILSQTYEYDPQTITEETIRSLNYQIKRSLLPGVLLKYINSMNIRSGTAECSWDTAVKAENYSLDLGRQLG